MPRGEGSRPKRENPPRGERTGAGLTDAKLKQWGFVVGSSININYGPWFEEQNPYRVLNTDFESENIDRGVIVESMTTGRRFVVVPSSASEVDFYEYNPGDLASTELTGEVTAHLPEK